MLVDIETDLNRDRIWVIWLYRYRDGRFKRICETDDEARLLRSFIMHLQDRDGPPAVYYGGNRFDEDCLKRRRTVHGVAEGVGLLENAHDLGITVQHYLLGAFRRTGLASLAGKLTDYEYAHPENNGFVVGSQYTQYLLDGT